MLKRDQVESRVYETLAELVMELAEEARNKVDMNSLNYGDEEDLFEATDLLIDTITSIVNRKV